MSQKERKRLKRIRNSVIERDGLICSYCDKELTLDGVTMDHIVPESKRGTYNTTNLTVSCGDCNNKRGDKPFWEFVKQFNFTEVKTIKFKKLYYNNLRIKILNVAKEQCMASEYVVPQDIINEACKVLKIKSINYDEFVDSITTISFQGFHTRSEVKFAFETLIKLIETKS